MSALRHRRCFTSPAGIVTICALAACAGSPGDDVPEKPLVVVSVPPQAWLVEQVAGELVDVEVMVPPGASPATHEPTMRQMTAVSRAAIYFKVGHGNFPFERAWIDRLIAGHDSLTVVDGAAGLDGSIADPHIWVSPRRVRVMVRTLTAALEQRLPGSAELLRRNEQALLAEIDALDAELAATLAPFAGRRFLVFHPGWGYFAEDYGLEQVSIEHGAKEPSPHDLADLVARAAADGITTVFVQPQFSPHAAELVARQIHGHVVEADPLARDWPDNLRRFAAALRQSFDQGSG